MISAPPDPSGPGRGPPALGPTEEGTWASFPTNLCNWLFLGDPNLLGEARTRRRSGGLPHRVMREETITDTVATPAASPTRPFHRCRSQGSGGISPCSLHSSAAPHSKQAYGPAPHMHPPGMRARAGRRLQPHVYDFKHRVAGGHRNFKGLAFQPEGKDFKCNCHIPAASHTGTALPPTHPTPQSRRRRGTGQGRGMAGLTDTTAAPKHRSHIEPRRKDGRSSKGLARTRGSHSGPPRPRLQPGTARREQAHPPLCTD